MSQYDIIIIGGGPGGYVAAIRAGQLGMKAACIDKNPALGGTCLRVGCIPSKAMLESSWRYHQAKELLGEHGVKVGEVGLDLGAMLRRKDKIVTINSKGIEGLFKKHGVTRYHGFGRITAPGKVTVATSSGPEELSAEHIVIATGSMPTTLPGIELDHDRIGTSTQALQFDEVPGHLVVIGGGYIGLELGSVWKRLGSEVTVLEYLDRILPGLDSEIADEAFKIFKKQGIKFRLGTRVTGAKVVDDTCIVEYEGDETIECDRVLVAVGRRAHTEGLGVEELGLTLDKAGRIEVDAEFSTGIEGVYAIGDVVKGPMLAHKAEEEGIALVERLATGYGHVDYSTIPAVVYTHPEIAAVGQTEDELKDAGVRYAKGVFPFMASGRARTLGETEGRVKVLTHAETDRIVGVHIIGPSAGDMIAEAATVMNFGATAEDVARSSHAHPTLSESLKEAAMAAWTGQAIHI